MALISLRRSRFRSPLLAALPPAAADRDRRSLRRRRLLVALSIMTLVVSAVLVKTRWLSSRGPGYALYWLHDTVYLTLKGWLFAWLFPGSWIYLLAALSLIAFGLVALTWKRPLTPSRQARVGCRLLGFRSIRGWMRGWDRKFKRGRGYLAAGAAKVQDWPGFGPFLARRIYPAWLVGPTLLDEVAEHEREAALGRLDALDPRDEDGLRTLELATELTIFSARVTAPLENHRSRQSHRSQSHQAEPEVMLTITRLMQVLLRLELTLAMTREEPVVAGSSLDLLEELRARIESEVVSRIGAFLPGAFLPSAVQQQSFALSALVTELALLLGPKGSAQRKMPNSSRRQILQGVLARKQMLDAGRHQIERWSAYGQRRRRGSGLADLEIPSHPCEARLAVDLALLAALRFEAPRSALAFLESLEGLRFALLTVAASGEIEVHLVAVEHLPQPFDYRVCAQLLGGDQTMRTMDADLVAAIGRRSKVVSRSDLELISARQVEIEVVS